MAASEHAYGDSIRAPLDGCKSLQKTDLSPTSDNRFWVIEWGQVAESFHGNRIRSYLSYMTSEPLSMLSAESALGVAFSDSQVTATNETQWLLMCVSRRLDLRNVQSLQHFVERE